MRKLFVIAVSVVLLAGCGVGTYSVQSGVENAAFISFTDDVKQEIVVSVDNHTYNLETVKQKAYKSGRNIKQTAQNTNTCALTRTENGHSRDPRGEPTFTHTE